MFSAILMITVLLVVGLVVSLSVGLPLSQHSSVVEPTPSHGVVTVTTTAVVPTVTTVAPTTTAVVPTPTPTVTPYVSPVMLFYDRFLGVLNTPLVSHVPDAPVGAFWELTSGLPQQWLLTGSNSASANTLLTVSPSPPSGITNYVYAGENTTGGSFVTQGYNPVLDTLRVRATLIVPTPTNLPVPPNLPGQLITQNMVLNMTNASSDNFTVWLTTIFGDPTNTLWDVFVAVGPSGAGVTWLSKSVPNASLPAGPIDIEFTIDPDGHCTFTSVAFGMSGSGPTTPVVIPKTGRAFINLTAEYNISETVVTPQHLPAEIQSLEIVALPPQGQPRVLSTAPARKFPH